MWGIIPPEPPRITALDGLAPRFREQVLALVAAQQGHFPVTVYESVRTAKRQAWLYGFGRTYDDGRGIVTNVESIWSGWHPHGLAVDMVSTAMAGEPPQHFWEEMHNRADVLGLAPVIHLAPGVCDWPHVQWKGMRLTPSWRSRVLVQTGGVDALWRAVGAA